MTFERYQFEASRFIPDGIDPKDMTTQSLLGLASEVGELCGLHEKNMRGHDIIFVEKMKEAGDILWYLCEYCTANNILLADVAERNINKLNARYASGHYTAEESIGRDESKE